MPTLHLFSTPGDRDIRWVIDACRPYLADKDEPTVAFLPQASLNVNHWLDYTTRSFEKLARVELIDTERMDLPKMESIIRKDQAFLEGQSSEPMQHRSGVRVLWQYAEPEQRV